jgi:hypothetical protein
MEPKNKKERTVRILKFSGLLLGTILLILLAAFFDFNSLPSKENKILRTKIEAVSKEKIYQEKFSTKANEIKALIDSLDVPGQNAQYFNALINSNIVELQKSIPQKDSTYNYEMYVNSVQAYVDIQELKTKLKTFEDVEAKLESYSQELERLSNELSTCNRYLDAYRNQ